MYVGLKMLTSFTTVTPKTLVKDANKLLEQDAGLLMLLVTDGDRLVGYIRKEDIAAALPSIMTTLEKHELNYLLSKLSCEKIIRRDITTVPPAMEIEVAAKIMYDKNLAGLAVVDHHGKLVGYINRTVMLAVLIEEMGLGQGGERIAFEVADRTGVIHEVAGIIAGMGLSIISTSTFYHNGRRMVVLRVATDTPADVEAAIAARGYRIVTAETFKADWKG